MFGIAIATIVWSMNVIDTAKTIAASTRFLRGCATAQLCTRSAFADGYGGGPHLGPAAELEVRAALREARPRVQREPSWRRREDARERERHEVALLDDALLVVGLADVRVGVRHVAALERTPSVVGHQLVERVDRLPGHQVQ